MFIFWLLTPDESSLEKLYNNNFKSKVVYVDFWELPAAEFRDFTQPLNDNFKDRNDIRYLYVAQGNEYLWREQII